MKQKGVKFTLTNLSDKYRLKGIVLNPEQTFDIDPTDSKELNSNTSHLELYVDIPPGDPKKYISCGSHGDILVRARPIGSFRMIDNKQADDKIIAVLYNDAVYGDYGDISDVPPKVLDRLKHYFLTYKDLPGEERDCYITEVRGIKETHHLINLAIEDYHRKFAGLESMLSGL